MIKLSLDPSSLKQFNNTLDMKIESIGEMTKQTYLDEVAKAAFVLVGERFMKAADRYAVQNPKKMHHVYEWGKLGNPSARLFVLERSSILNGSVSTLSKFKASRTQVPINPALLIPNKHGKYVNRRSVFRDKAQVMEDGLPITYQAQRMLAFMGKGGMKFIRPGVTVHITNPGGVATKNAFSKFMLDWYNRNAQSIMDSSGLYERIVNQASIVLNKNSSSPAEMRRAVQEVIESVSQGKVIIK